MSAETLAVPARVPEGYVTGRERGAEIVALPSAIRIVSEALVSGSTLYDWAAASAGARSFTGRGAAWAVSTPAGDWVVRHYRRGGAVARVLRDRYLRAGASRPLKELRASVAARGRGVPTPEIVAAVVYGAGPVYRADLATRLVPEAADLADVTLGPARLAEPGREAAWRAAGALLKLALAAGVEHRDLNLRNILVQRPASRAPLAFLLDLDRARVHEQPVSDVVRAGMLERLHRSRRKLEARLGVATTPRELDAFEEGLRS